MAPSKGPPTLPAVRPELVDDLLIEVIQSAMSPTFARRGRSPCRHAPAGLEMDVMPRLVDGERAGGALAAPWPGSALVPYLTADLDPRLDPTMTGACRTGPDAGATAVTADGGAGAGPCIDDPRLARGRHQADGAGRSGPTTPWWPPRSSSRATPTGSWPSPSPVWPPSGVVPDASAPRHGRRPGPGPGPRWSPSPTRRPVLDLAPIAAPLADRRHHRRRPAIRSRPGRRRAPPAARSTPCAAGSASPLANGSCGGTSPPRPPPPSGPWPDASVPWSNPSASASSPWPRRALHGLGSFMVVEHEGRGDGSGSGRPAACSTGSPAASAAPTAA